MAKTLDDRAVIGQIRVNIPGLSCIVPEGTKKYFYWKMPLPKVKRFTLKVFGVALVWYVPASRLT
jgi:hypothetical protein